MTACGGLRVGMSGGSPLGFDSSPELAVAMGGGQVLCVVMAERSVVAGQAVYAATPAAH